MKLLTPTEHAALTRLLVPHGMRELVQRYGPLGEATLELVEHGRATKTLIDGVAEWRGETRQRRWWRIEITPAGREALRLWPAVAQFFAPKAP